HRAGGPPAAEPVVAAPGGRGAAAGREWAARRSLMESLHVPVGYGVELAALLDTASRHGLDALAQVDLGSRAHKHQANHDLAVMAAELLIVAERRRPAPCQLAPGATLRQFAREDGVVSPRLR